MVFFHKKGPKREQNRYKLHFFALNWWFTWSFLLIIVEFYYPSWNNIASASANINLTLWGLALLRRDLKKGPKQVYNFSWTNKIAKFHYFFMFSMRQSKFSNKISFIGIDSLINGSILLNKNLTLPRRASLINNPQSSSSFLLSTITQLGE